VRTSMPVLTTLFLSLGLAACGTGDEGDICQLAAQHVSDCLARPAPAAPACDVELAGQLLAASCGQIQSLQAGTGKADWLGDKDVYAPDAICDPDDPDDTGCESYCRSIRVEYSFFGIFKLDGCLYRSSCDRVGDGMARCQCKFSPGSCDGEEPWSDPEPAAEEPGPEEPGPEEPEPEEPEPEDPYGW
jgi:hypothetical protein